MNVSVEVEGLGAASAFAQRFATELPAATSRAVNRAVKHGYTRAARGITSETGLQRKYIVPSLSLRQSTPSTLEGVLQAKTRRVPLIAYLRTGFRSGRGIGGRAYIGGVASPRAFFARFKSGKRVVAERIGRKRSELRVLTGPPIPTVIVERHVYQTITGPVREYFDTRLAHEVQRLLDRRAAVQGEAP